MRMVGDVAGRGSGGRFLFRPKNKIIRMMMMMVVVAQILTYICSNLLLLCYSGTNQPSGDRNESL